MRRSSDMRSPFDGRRRRERFATPVPARKRRDRAGVKGKAAGTAGSGRFGNGSSGGIRTPDLVVNSHPLYR